MSRSASGQPSRAQVPTPPSTTWSTAAAPCTASGWPPHRCAALSCRSPRRHTGSIPSGNPAHVVVGRVGGAGMWPSSHSACSRTSRTLKTGLGRKALVHGRHVDALDPVGAALLLSPARHAAGEVAADSRDPTAAARLAARTPPRRRGRSGRSWARSATTRASCRTPHGPGMETEPGQVRLVELQPRADVHDERTGDAHLLHLPRRERMASTSSRIKGPRLRSTTAWKLGGCGGSDPVARSTKRSSSDSFSRSLWRRSKPIVDETFMSMPGLRTAIRRGGRAIPRRCRPAAAAAWCSERKIARAPSSLSTARSGRAMSPTNSVSPVRMAHGSGPRAVSISAKAVCSGRCPGV